MNPSVEHQASVDNGLKMKIKRKSTASSDKPALDRKDCAAGKSACQNTAKGQMKSASVVELVSDSDDMPKLDSEITKITATKTVSSVKPKGKGKRKGAKDEKTPVDMEDIDRANVAHIKSTPQSNKTPSIEVRSVTPPASETDVELNNSEGHLGGMFGEISCPLARLEEGCGGQVAVPREVLSRAEARDLKPQAQQLTVSH